jgi:hypothetical protein
MNPEDIPLRDLHLPADIGWWPLAPGWWLVIALGLLGLALLARQFLAGRRLSAGRRYALRELERLAAGYRHDKDAVRFSARLSALLRRTMLAYAPRHDVAGLTGEEWLRWLDQDLPEPQFQSAAGRRLIELPYRQPQFGVAEGDIEALLAAVRVRLTTPVGRNR